MCDAKLEPDTHSIICDDTILHLIQNIDNLNVTLNAHKDVTPDIKMDEQGIQSHLIYQSNHISKQYKSSK